MVGDYQLVSIPQTTHILRSNHMSNMRTYVGIEEVDARPMTRGQYNTIRGWNIPADENPSDEGYYILRGDGYITWVPKDVFENIYSEEIDNSVEMVDLKHDLHTTKYTKVSHEKDFKFNAPHLFHVDSVNGLSYNSTVGIVHFQEGPINEAGVNGVSNEDLIHMVICRLEHFQKSQYSSRDNALAITHLEDALLRLRKRTIGRESRGVEGTSVV
jgi:hypothetical protein